jgi:hypothetical protein
MTTNTITKRRMMAELLFQNILDAHVAVRALTKRGFTFRVPDWTDPEDTEAVLALALIDNELSQEAFSEWMAGIVESLGGDVIEAGCSGSNADVEAWIGKKVGVETNARRSTVHPSSIGARAAGI